MATQTRAGTTRRPVMQRRGPLMPKPTTTERGLGWEHQQARALALAKLKPGTPCPYCSQGMYRDQALDLDHQVPRVYGGAKGPRRLAHATCNRRDGQAIGIARRKRVRPRTTRVINSRVW
jgi:hypothetical protein